MKKLILIMTLMMASLLGSSQAHAVCMVTTEADNTTDSGTLRSKIENTYNNNTTSNCAPIAAETALFDQSVIFATDELGYANNIKKIVFGSTKNKKMTFDNAGLDIVVGNWSSAIVNDTTVTSGTYTASYIDTLNKGGYKKPVIIDGQTNFDKGIMPLICASNTSTVFLRNLVILTNGITQADFYKQGACFKNAGATFVCEGTLNPAVEAGTMKPGESGWCGTMQAPIPSFSISVTPAPTSVNRGGEVALTVTATPTGTVNPEGIFVFMQNDVKAPILNDLVGGLKQKEESSENALTLAKPLTMTLMADADAATGDRMITFVATTLYYDDVQKTFKLFTTTQTVTVTVTNPKVDCEIKFNPPSVTMLPTDLALIKVMVNPLNGYKPGLNDIATVFTQKDAKSGLSDDGAAKIGLGGFLFMPLKGDGTQLPGVYDVKYTAIGGTGAAFMCQQTMKVTIQSPGDVDKDGDGFPAKNDCDDNNAAIYPGAAENCTDGIDNNCDGKIDGADLQCKQNPNDKDGDGWLSNGGDCDDNNAKINPNAKEVCGDGIDNDCDGKADIFDNECTLPSGDLDLDGDTFTPNQGDCNDKNAAVNPGAKEACDGVDNNCDGVVDYANMDGDAYFSVCPSDCDDTNGKIYPKAPEVCSDGIDQDCDGKDTLCAGMCPDGSKQRTYYADVDGDTFGSPSATRQGCSKPDGYVNDNRDCNDSNPLVNPNATELCTDSIDNNCDGAVDVSDAICDVGTPPPPPEDDPLYIYGSSATGGCSLNPSNHADISGNILLILIALIPMGLMVMLKKKRMG